jgi:hypothetical protein
MDTKPRLTKQGIKDLNHYGPKPVRASAGNPGQENGQVSGQVSGQPGGEAGDEAMKTSLPTVDQKPDAPVSVGA